VQHQGRSERLGQLAGRGVFEVRANLGKIRAVIGTGVQVDTDIATFDHLGHQKLCDP